VMWSETVNFRTRLVWDHKICPCDWCWFGVMLWTLSHYDLEGHSNFSSTIYSFSSTIYSFYL